MPESRPSAIFGPTPGDLDEAAEQATLRFAPEAIEHVRVLAHHQMRQQLHLGADRRQVKERRHRRLDLIADAADLDGQLRRRLCD